MKVVQARTPPIQTATWGARWRQLMKPDWGARPHSGGAFPFCASESETLELPRSPVCGFGTLSINCRA